MKIIFHKPSKGETYKIKSPSQMLHKRFGQNLEIRIVDEAQRIYGDDFMEQSEEGVCRFYRTRLDEIPYIYREVYLGKIDSYECLVHVSELDFSSKNEIGG